MTSCGQPLVGIVGRDAERRRIDEFVRRLDVDARSLALVGEAGIGKTTLWSYGLAGCRAAGAQVLVARPSEDDQQSPAQGLMDLFDPRYLNNRLSDGVLLEPDLPVVDRSRLVLKELRVLAAGGPVVIAVDDLPWLDDVTARVLRFALRRLANEPVALLTTSRTWSPDAFGTPAHVLDRGVDMLELQAMAASDVRRIVVATVPAVRLHVAVQAADLAHGNPFFAIELARTHSTCASWSPAGSPLALLAVRVADLAPDALHLARLLAVAGPSALRVLISAGGLDDPDGALRAGLDAGIFTFEDDFVLRFTHPLIATAVVQSMNALDRRKLNAVLADAVTEPDTRAIHLANAVVGPDAAVAEEVEAAALRLARAGSPRLAADLLAHSARLTPPQEIASSVRRTLAQMMQRAIAGDLSTALQLATALLERLEPGPLRAEVVTGRVVIDFSDAERFLRSALADVPGDGRGDHECLRGRLLGLLGWLLGVHMGRLAEGLGYARAGLEIGRVHGDSVLVAQASSAVATASLLLGQREDKLMDDAVALGPEVVQSQLALWPRVLLGRQQLWDGHLAKARANLDLMYRTAVSNGAEHQRPYRLTDLALVSQAAGDVDLAAQQAGDGMEAARDSGDERAIAWLAYPLGLVSAMHGDASAAGLSADRLDWWATRMGERPRHAMACHVRGVLAASGQEWASGVDHLLSALSILDDMCYAHPGFIPVLVQAIQLATMAGSSDCVDRLQGRLLGQCEGLASPWADAQLTCATGQQMLLRDEPDALTVLTTGRQELARLGYRLDAARIGCFAAAAGLRAGQRGAARMIAEETLETLSVNRIRGWDVFARGLVERIRGSNDDQLTGTESEIAVRVSDGQRNREIAVSLFISESTVEAHLTRIYRKLALRNRADLSRWVELSGLRQAAVVPAR